MEKIVFPNGREFLCAVQAEPSVHTIQSNRQWKRLALINTTLEDALSAFVDNAVYTYTWDSMRYLTQAELEQFPDHLTDENSMPYIIETYESDLSEYCIAGDIVVCRNGNIIVYMGKKTEQEVYQEAMDNLMLEVLGG